MDAGQSRLGRRQVADDHGEAEAIASYITDAPEEFLHAVARLVLGDEETRAELATHEAQWGQPLPRTELEVLRTAMRSHQSRQRSLNSGPRRPSGVRTYRA
jgi:hypothetical protein